jgi:hypothetical protein
MQTILRILERAGGYRCTCIREVGSNLHVLSRKVELRFGQRVEALYVVCREGQA